MPCYSPLTAYRTRDGSVIFTELARHGDTVPLLLSCGQCVGCRLERSRQWAVRCVHEAQLWKRNCFITLTYDDAHFPLGGSLVYRDYQLFMKRLRRRFSAERPRFFMCGEYGDENSRPHFHACLFNFDFPDRYKFRGMDRSPLLEELWGQKGFCCVGDVTFESAAYVARYIVKKVTGPNADLHYRGREPEFCHMSLKPGIGAGWMEKYLSDVYPSGRVVVRGKEAMAPKYYDKKFKALFPEKYEELVLERQAEGWSRKGENYPKRRVVRRAVAQARVDLLKRSL